MKWFDVIGLIAAVCIAVYNIPMFIKILKTKNTAGISLIMYILLVLGCWCFFIDGLGITICVNAMSGLPMIISNLFGVAISTIILVIKCNNMSKAKAANMTEAKYCEEKWLRANKKEKK